jgi:kinesin family protein 18/19
MDMIVRGNEYRTMSPTEANATSSRSHAVLQINLSMKDRNADVNEPHTMATLSIIDLAGSERASATKNRGERLIEGANINKSLLALGSCINALCDPRKRNHVPYRNSKLTRLLKFALGGNCKTVMIVCVSPSSVHFDETQNTLRYANRAKNIQTKVTRNVYNVNRHVKDFLKKIDEQMALINELKQQQKDYEATAFAKFRKLVEKKEAIAREGVGRIRAAYENSAPERHERMNMMKKLRHIERRISLISTWIAGFDAVCDSRDEEEPPKNLVAMRKTAQGILTELEGSRQHYHQRLSKHTWDRALESALQTGIRQLRESDGSDGSEISALIREAEVLRGMADREAHTALLEQDKCGDSALIQVLLQAHFDTIAILDQILQMSEEDAVDAAKKLLGPIVAACTSASSQAIKPDGGLPVTEAFPPSKSGTPKRRKPANLIGPSPVPILDMARFMEPSLENLTNSSPVKGSPARSSPRRRRLGPAKKGISFTPKKKSPTKAGKRAVRWKDDTDDGPLAEYQATPKAIYSSTPEASSTELPPPPPKFTVIPLAPNFQTPYEEGSSPLPAPPESSLNLKGARPSRFQAGFLSKTSKSSPSDGSPTLDGLPPAPAAGGLNFSSDSDTSPLRELHPNRVPHHQLSPLHAVTNASAASSGDVTPADTASNGSASDDERRGGAAAPPKRASVVGMGHSKKGSWHVSSADAKTIRSALKRTSSVNGAPGSASSLSASVGGGGGSAPPSRAHRRRSPTASSGSPPSADSSLLLSTGQVRRMGLGLHHGENWRASAASVLSPRSAPIVKGAAAGLVAAAAAAARRTTVGEEVRGGVRGAPVRMSVGGAKVGGKAVWR